VARSALVFTVSRDFPRAAEGILLATAFPGCAPSRGCERGDRLVTRWPFYLRKSNAFPASDFLLRKYRTPRIYAGADTCAKRALESPIFKDSKAGSPKRLRARNETNEKKPLSDLSDFIRRDKRERRLPKFKDPFVPLNIPPASRRMRLAWLAARQESVKVVQGAEYIRRRFLGSARYTKPRAPQLTWRFTTSPDLRSSEVVWPARKIDAPADGRLLQV